MTVSGPHFEGVGQMTSMTKSANEPTRSAVASGEQIAARAYQLYEARGCAEGHALEDWLQAEAELSDRSQKAEARKSPRSPRRVAARSVAGSAATNN
jgi:hypothetical protein